MFKKLKELLTDLKLGFYLLKREGFKKFFHRTVWYLKGSRLKEEIFESQNKKFEASWLKDDFVPEKLETPPLVSVVIPAYNHEKFIAEAISSVTNQTYENLEIILVDDGSSDQTLEIAKKTLENSPRPHQIFSQENQGAHAAINFGVSKSKGKYVTVLNSDDFYDTERFSTIIPALENSDSSVAFSSVEWVDGDSRIMKDHGLATEFGLKLKYAQRFPSCGFALLDSNIAISTGNIVFTRELFDNIGGFKDLKFCHDWDFILETLKFTEPIVIPEKLYNYRFHGDNTFLKLQDILADEHKTVLGNFLKTKNFQNPIFPCAAKWPDYFPEFIREHGYKQYLA